MHVSCDKSFPACVRCSEINRGGLLLIYKILVDTAQADIAKSLQVGGAGWGGWVKRHGMVYAAQGLLL